MDLVLTVLPFLACPLMMVFCLFGMRKMGGGAPPASETRLASQLPEERVAALQQQLLAIQAELTTLQPAPVPLPALAPVSSDRLMNIAPSAGNAAQHPA